MFSDELRRRLRAVDEGRSHDEGPIREALSVKHAAEWRELETGPLPADELRDLCLFRRALERYHADRLGNAPTRPTRPIRFTSFRA